MPDRDLATIHHGDCLATLDGLPEASVDAIVTDPPYGLGFMGKAWDDLPPGREWAEACYRVLKPGGHLLAFGGTRTWHRLAVAVEDAGFEMRDSIAWLYGSGFPKSLDVSKAIDKAAGATREIVGQRSTAASRPITAAWQKCAQDKQSAAFGAGEGMVVDVTAPATPEAEEWQGWGTALKPAFEPIVVARKPLIGTVAANVLTHGTGALNIDACRVGYTSDADKASARPGGKATSLNGALAGKEQICEQNGSTEPSTPAETRATSTNSQTASAPSVPTTPPTSRTEFEVKQGAGRWPANVVLDESQADTLDQQSGITKSSGGSGDKSGKLAANVYGDYAGTQKGANAGGLGDSGGASRFFYVAKAPKKERPNVDGIAHPTVKPLTLMRWLVRLVTPPGGTVLDPFAGSGTTIEAAILEGFYVIGIEREAEYLPLIQHRINRQAPDPDEQLDLLA